MFPSNNIMPDITQKMFTHVTITVNTLKTEDTK